MQLGPSLLVIVVVLAVSAVVGCGEQERPAAERLSRPAAVARIDVLCRQTLEEVERAGQEPSVASGTMLALRRYERWQERVLAVTEAGLRRIERVAIPADARAKEIQAYVYWGRELITAARKLLQAVRDGDRLQAELQESERNSSADQAGYAAKRYGLSECGA